MPRLARSLREQKRLPLQRRRYSSRWGSRSKTLQRRSWSSTPRRVMSLSEVVQGPVVAVARDPLDAGERRRKLGPRMVLQVFDHAAFGAAEIGCVPDIDRRDGEFARCQCGAPRMIDIVAGGLVEQCFGVARGECRRLQIRAAEGGAIDRVMHTRVAPNRPQGAMLDVVETERLAFNRDDLLAPRP